MGRWERISSPSCLLSEPHTQGQDRLRNLGKGRKSAGSAAQVQEIRDEHPSGFCPSLQLRQATNQAWQLWGQARGPGEALPASTTSGLRGCRQKPARRKREENVKRWSSASDVAGRGRRGGARRGAGGGRQGALGCGAGAPGWRAQEAGTRTALGWRCEQAERKPGQGQRGKRQGVGEIQEEEVDEDEAGPPAGSGGGGGGGGREKRLAGS